MFRVRDLMGAIGVMLFLVAMYLVLRNATGAVQVIATLSSGGAELIRNLQGRT